MKGPSVQNRDISISDGEKVKGAAAKAGSSRGKAAAFVPMRKGLCIPGEGQIVIQGGFLLQAFLTTYAGKMENMTMR